MTRQRQVILEELRRTRTHPTADQVYARVRRRLPRISLGTVYRNLETLASRGMVGKLDLGGGPMRFDGDVSRHQHVRCLGCGRIADTVLDEMDALASGVRNVKGYEITGYRLELLGRCARCKRKGHRSAR